MQWDPYPLNFVLSFQAAFANVEKMPGDVQVIAVTQLGTLDAFTVDECPVYTA